MVWSGVTLQWPGQIGTVCGLLAPVSLEVQLKSHRAEMVLSRAPPSRSGMFLDSHRPGLPCTCPPPLGGCIWGSCALTLWNLGSPIGAAIVQCLDFSLPWVRRGLVFPPCMHGTIWGPHWWYRPVLPPSLLGVELPCVSCPPQRRLHLRTGQGIPV